MQCRVRGMGSWGSQEKTPVASVCREESQNASALSRLSCSILNCSHKTLDPSAVDSCRNASFSPSWGIVIYACFAFRYIFSFVNYLRLGASGLDLVTTKAFGAVHWRLNFFFFLKADSPNLLLFWTFLGILVVIHQLFVSDAYILKSILIYLYVSVCEYVHMYVGVLRGQRGNESPAAGITGSCESPDMGIGEQIWVSGKAPSACSQSHFPGLGSYILSILVYFFFLVFSPLPPPFSLFLFLG